MKKILVVLAVLAVLIGGAIAALPYLVPMERIEREVLARFEAATGRTLTYGHVRVFAWPNVGLRLQDVRVSNPDWAQNDTLLALGEMDVSLSARALLEKKVDVKRFVLKQPVIALEKAADGRVSWELKPAADVKKAVDAPAGTAAEQPKGGAAGAFDVALGEVSIVDGQISYRDAAAGTTETVKDVDLSIVMPDLQSALNIDGSMVLREKRVNVVLSVDKPFDLINGATSTGSLNVNADVLKAEVAGTLSTKGTMLKGRVNADISSLPGLIAWAGQQAEKPLPVKTVSVASTAEVSAENLSFTGATLRLDDMQGGGDVKVALGGARPSIHARLNLDRVNLDRFIAGDADRAGEVAKKDAPSAAGGWDATPIDFSSLKAADVDAVVETKGFVVKGVDVGASTLTARLANGNLRFSTTDAALFGGRARAEIGVNASGATPALSARINLDGVQAKPVLATFADFDKLSGTTEAALNVTASGRSQQALVSTLAGDGRVVFRNGAIEGIDAVNLARAIQSKLGEMGVGQGKTDFVEMGGSFTIANGIATNSDLSLKGPLVQATGQGTVDLPKKYVRYRAVPVLTASSAVQDAGGIRVPVDIVGPFSNLKIRPDYAAVLQDALKDPKKLKENLKQVEDTFDPLKDNVRNLRKDLKDDPAKAIEGFIGGGGIGGLLKAKPQPAAPVAPAAPAAAPAPEAEPAAAPAVPAETPPTSETPTAETTTP